MRQMPAIPTRPPRWSRSAFTVLEMMVVLMILAILATLAVPRLTGTARREFRLAVDQVSDLLTMFAQREQLGRRPVGLRYETADHRLALVVLDSDPDETDVVAAWTHDRHVSPIALPPHVFVQEVTADGDAVDINDWPLSTAPSERRPTIAITLLNERDGEVATLVLAGHAIVPQEIGAAAAGVYIAEPEDLDAAGRSREDW